MYASAAVTLLNAYAEKVGVKPQVLFSGNLLDCFDIAGQGSHKYIPEDALNSALGLPSGAGVFGYVKFSDCSYVLRLCDGRVIAWSGDIEDLPTA